MRALLEVHGRRRLGAEFPTVCAACASAIREIEARCLIGRRRIVAFLIALGVFALDRWSKWMVETHLSGYDTKTVIPGFFNIVRSQNPGVAFGMFAESLRSRARRF